MRAPAQPGDYEIRYITGHLKRTIATTKLTVMAASASLDAPDSVVAGSTFQVRWEGPGHRLDKINLAKKAAPDDKSESYDYVTAGRSLLAHAPLAPGEYELRYVGFGGTILARAALQVTPGKEEPGTISVRIKGRGAEAANHSAVEIVLDASGSMLQKIGSKRRIDIARETLAKLARETIPTGTQFAVRVLGLGDDACRSTLELPLQALDPGAVDAKLAPFEPKRNSKTPIGAALEAVAEDLSSVKGERLVVLITDGEETCGGNAAASIEKLRQGGADVRINIVGFAIDDRKLTATFRRWAELGKGAYFEARNASGLNSALSAALRPRFQIADGSGALVAEGVAGDKPVTVTPGKYLVSLAGRVGAETVTVSAKANTVVEF